MVLAGSTRRFTVERIGRTTVRHRWLSDCACESRPDNRRRHHRLEFVRGHRGVARKAGLKPRPGLGAHNERLLGIGNDEYIVVIESMTGEPTDKYVPESASRHTHAIASNDYERFTFISRIRSRQEQKRDKVQYQ